MHLSNCGQPEPHGPHLGTLIHMGEEELPQERIYCLGAPAGAT